jgi:hypothetical protein
LLFTLKIGFAKAAPNLDGMILKCKYSKMDKGTKDELARSRGENGRK